MNILIGLNYVEVAENGSLVASKELKEMRKDKSFNWNHLPEFLSTGVAWKEIDKTLESLDDFYLNFFEDMQYAEQMLPVARAVANRIPPRSTELEILDIGAGTGVWSLTMAGLHTTSSITAVDLPQVLKEHFTRRAESLGLLKRIEMLAGDFHQVPYPKNRFDRVIMGQSYQFLRESESQKFLSGIAASLKADGNLVVIHHFADSTPQQRLSRKLYEMRLAMRSKNTKNYSRDEMRSMCRQVGLTLSDSFEVDGPDFLSVMVFSKASNSAH